MDTTTPIDVAEWIEQCAYGRYLHPMENSAISFLRELAALKQQPRHEGAEDARDVGSLIRACTAYNDHVGRDKWELLADVEGMRKALHAAIASERSGK